MTADTPSDPAPYDLEVPVQHEGGRYLFDPATGKSTPLPEDEEEAAKILARAASRAAKADEPRAAKTADTAKGAD